MDKRLDKELAIHTRGLREWDKKHRTLYNRTESTPYRALDELFRHYHLQPHDILIDFGCGRGRVLLYTHYCFDVPVRGVELHDQTFNELDNNRLRYQERHPHRRAPIQLEFGYASDYHIQDENVFFFFNPFSFVIFRRILRNIQASLGQNPRSADLILYYPLDEFRSFMDSQTLFQRHKRIRLPWESDQQRHFLIYSYQP